LKNRSVVAFVRCRYWRSMLALWWSTISSNYRAFYVIFSWQYLAQLTWISTTASKRRHPNTIAAWNRCELRKENRSIPGFQNKHSSSNLFIGYLNWLKLNIKFISTGPIFTFQCLFRDDI